MEIIQQNFELENISFKCFMVHVENEVWFKAKDIADFLGYSDSKQAIKLHVFDEWKKPFDELVKNYQYPFETPSNWQSNTIFINEPGLYSLLFRSKKDIALVFSKWVCEQVLPSIRKRGYYSLKEKYEETKKLASTVLKEKDELNSALWNTYMQLDNTNTALIECNKEKQVLNNRLNETTDKLVEYCDAMVSMNSELSQLTNRITDIAQNVTQNVNQKTTHNTQDSVSAMEKDPIIHIFQVSEAKSDDLRLSDDEVCFVFTRCQKRFFNRTESANKRKYNIRFNPLIRKPFIPNGVNLLNVVKQKLRQNGIYYKSKINILTVHRNDKEFVERIISSVMNEQQQN